MLKCKNIIVIGNFPAVGGEQAREYLIDSHYFQSKSSYTYEDQVFDYIYEQEGEFIEPNQRNVQPAKSKEFPEYRTNRRGIIIF